MGQNVIVTSSKFFSQIKNGSTFASNTGDYTVNLVGSVFEKLKLVKTVEVSWFSQPSSSDQFYFVAAGQVVRGFGSFLDDGFSPGDTFHFNDVLVGSATTFFTGTVTAISSDGLTMYYTVNTGTDQTGNNFSAPACFRGTTVLKSLLYKFGLIENDEATNYINKATNKEQAYTFENLTVSTAGLPVGGINVWEAGSITCSTGVITSTYYQTFTIEHIFLNPYYAPGYELDYDTNIIPAEYDGTASLKYVSEHEFRAVFSNPNGAKIGVDDKNRGSTAWFGENFNGLNSNYTLGAVSFEDTATVTAVDGLQKGAKTRVTAVITCNFVAGEDYRYGIYVSKAPATVGNLADTLPELFIEEGLVSDVDAVAANGTIITNATAVSIAATSVTIEFDVEFSSLQQARIASGDYFLIGLQISHTETLTNATSDKVTLMASYAPFIVNDDVSGLLVWRDNRYYNHLQVYPDTSPDLINSQHNFKGWIEDGILNNFNFDLDLALFAKLVGLKVEFIAYNTVTEEFWVISSYTFNTALFVSSPIDGYDAYQFAIRTKRDFNLPVGDQFNLVLLETATALKNTSFLNYNAVCTFKIDWQKWIYNPNVNSAFYDASELKLGFNQHSATFYENAGDWKLRFRITATIDSQTTGDAGPILTDYKFLSPNIQIKTYDVDGYDPPKWTQAITTWTEDGATEITPKVLSNGNTLFKIVWTWNTAVYGDMATAYADFVAIHRIEPHYVQASNVIEEFSSIRTNLAQKLKGVTGNTSPQTLKVVEGVSTVTTTCLIDFSQLDQNSNYKLSGRLFGLDALLGLTWEEINIPWEDINIEFEFL